MVNLEIITGNHMQYVISGTSLLNDFGLKDFVLHDFGTIKIPDTAGAIAALLISAASIVGGKILILLLHNHDLFLLLFFLLNPEN